MSKVTCAHRAGVPLLALGASERLFVAMRRFAATNVVRMVAIEGELPPELLRRALWHLQRRHPRLSWQLGDHSFEPVSDATIPLHLVARAGEEAWVDHFEHILNTPIPAGPGPLLHVHHLAAPGSARSELFVVGDHAICDGVSINALCAELLALCAGAPPSPPRPAVAPLDRLLPPFGRVSRSRAFAEMAARFALLAALRGLHERRTAGRTTRLLTCALTEPETTALVARATREQTTVTAALLAAALAAIEPGRALPRRLALSVPVNLRPRLDGQGLEPADLGHYTNVAYLAARRGGPLWPRARKLKRQLGDGLRGGRLLAALPAMYRTGARFVSEGRPPFAHVLVSSSGITPLKADYGGFRARDFVSGTSAAMLSADFGFFANTFDGRLRINLVFLEEVVRPDDAARVLERMRRALVVA